MCSFLICVGAARAGACARARRSRCAAWIARAAASASVALEQRRELRGDLRGSLIRYGVAATLIAGWETASSIAVAVGDRAAAGGDGDAWLLLRGGGLAQRAGLDDAEPERLGGRRGRAPTRKTAKRRPIRRSISRTRSTLRRLSAGVVAPRAGWSSSASGWRSSPAWRSGRRVGGGRDRGRRRRGGGRRPARRSSRSSRASCWRRPRRRAGHDAAVGHQLARGVARRRVMCRAARVGVDPGAHVQVADVAGGRRDHARPCRRRARMRSPDARARRSAPRCRRSGARASPSVSTAREMPAFSFSSDTCIATIPPSAMPMQPDPHAPAQQAVDDAVVGERAQSARRRRCGRRRRRGARTRGGRRAGRGAGRIGPETRRCEPRSRRGAAAARACAASVRVLLVSLRAARRRADFARGLAATSPGVGTTERRHTGSASGVRPQAQTGRSGGQMQPCAPVGEEALDAPVLERVEARSRRAGRSGRSTLPGERERARRAGRARR